MMDTDMYLRKPIDPLAMGCTRGTVVSAKYSYLYGITSGFARHFIDEALHERMAGVGGFHIFHREDLRQIAPLWLEYTKKVRAFANAHPDQYFNESFHYQSPPGSPGPTPLEMATKHKQARWHGEMYGYVFAAAEVGVTHRVREVRAALPRPAPPSLRSRLAPPMTHQAPPAPTTPHRPVANCSCTPAPSRIPAHHKAARDPGCAGRDALPGQPALLGPRALHHALWLRLHLRQQEGLLQ